MSQPDADAGTWIRVLWLRRDTFTRTTSPVEEKGERGHSLKRRAPDPCLEKLLLLFWAQYIEDDPHLLCTGSLQVVTENKEEGVANYIKEEGYLQM